MGRTVKDNETHSVCATGTEQREEHPVSRYRCLFGGCLLAVQPVNRRRYEFMDSCLCFIASLTWP